MSQAFHVSGPQTSPDDGALAAAIAVRDEIIAVFVTNESFALLPRTSRPLASAVLPGDFAMQKAPRGAPCK